MIDAGIDWRHISPEVATDPLKSFLIDLVEPRSIRNAIAHGLGSVHSNPWEPDFEPYLNCRTRDGGSSKITLSDLRRTQSQLQSLRNVLRGFAPPILAKTRR